MSTKHSRPLIGLALGSGSARGWAHIGVLKALKEMDIEPDIVCGTSIGSLVGGLYVSGQLDKLHNWILGLDRREIIKYLDISLLTGGGFVEGKNLMTFFQKHMGDFEIESLDKSFASVATNLASGREVWIQKGSILEAMRASMALPGLFTPVLKEDEWLVDGGIVNPVPVSVCKALGAEKVIAVNLNGDIVGKHLNNNIKPTKDSFSTLTEETLLEKFSENLMGKASKLFPDLFNQKINNPGLFDVLASSINIMQDRITRSRMAGDPPDILLSPKIAQIGLMEFDRAEEAISAGENVVKQFEPYLKELIH